MRNILIFICFALIFSMTACGSGSLLTSGNDPGTTDPSSSPSPTPTNVYSDTADVVTSFTLVSGTDATTPCDVNSDNLAISANGKFIAFESGCSDLIANDSNNKTDIFVK